MLTDKHEPGELEDMLIFNNGFQKFNNNNQLRSANVPFPITTETFEMYASELNSIVHNSKEKHNKKCYCSLNGGDESIG